MGKTYYAVIQRQTKIEREEKSQAEKVESKEIERATTGRMESRAANQSMGVKNLSWPSL